MKEKFLLLKDDDSCLGGILGVGRNDIEKIKTTADGKISFIGFNEKTFCAIDSCCGQQAIYPLKEISIKKPIKYVVMDLDGTSITSEELWIEIIRLTVSRILGKEIEFSEEDIPFVFGHTTIEHLDYALKKYGEKNVDYGNVADIYYEVSRIELEKKMEGGLKGIGLVDGLKEFLLELKRRGKKIGLVSSGLFYKAIPEIENAFKQMQLGDPKQFYDAIIMGGVEKRKGNYATLGELAAKPHPWLYKELVYNGLKVTDNSEVLVIEDSASGVLSARLAGYAVIGMNSGNIAASGLSELCLACVDTFDDVLKIIS